MNNAIPNRDHEHDADGYTVTGTPGGEYEFSTPEGIVLRCRAEDLPLRLLDKIREADERRGLISPPLEPLFVMPMPLNAGGGGPEMDPDKVVATQYEVWDQNNLSVGVLAPKDAGIFAGHEWLAERAERLEYVARRAILTACSYRDDGHPREWLSAELKRLQDLLRGPEITNPKGGG